MSSDDRILLISADCHAGPLPETIRSYIAPKYREAFDAWMADEAGMESKDYDEQDWVIDPGATMHIAAYPNLLVLRSLSKTAGIAGLRIGFAIGAAAVVDRVSRVTGPYDINSFAVSAAFAALADQPYVDAYVAEVLAARQWLVERLVAAGVRHHVDGGNYLLIWPQRPAAEVDQALREAGILVRSMAGKPLIDGSLRVSLGTLEQMGRFWEAFAICDARPA